MADEVPVCDVLSEAMEYLAKLGTNLRARSENLKEKRISKGKLKNSHAVQKVANKVLLICELSKKSLDNVETGVRKVLSLVERTYGVSSNNGAKPLESGKESRPVHFIDYKSQKLRMSTKINLKHYMSVKVSTQQMSPAKQSKYPVYYDCKLFRTRINESKTQKGEGVESDENFPIKITPERKSSLNHDRTIDNDTIVSEMDKASPKAPNTEKHDNDRNKHSETVTEDKKASKKRKLSSDSYCEEKKRKKHKQCSDVDLKDKNIRKETSDEKSPDKSNKTIENSKISSSEINKQCSEQMETSECHKKKDDCIKIAEERTKRDDELKKCDTDKTLESQDNSKERSHLESDQNEENRENTDNNSETSENNKPLIRCININKLLKPDIAVKTSPKSLTDNEQLTTINTKPVKLHSTNSGPEKSVGASKSDEEYLAQKKADIKAFKPKKFSINISRLPKLSQSFLHKYGLVRVVKKGHVIFEIKNSKICNASNSSVERISKVKHALLNDSDSDEKQSLPVKSKRGHKEIIDSSSGNNKIDQNHVQHSDNNIEDLDEAMTNNIHTKDGALIDSSCNLTQDSQDTNIQEKNESTGTTVDKDGINIESNKSSESKNDHSKKQDRLSDDLDNNWMANSEFSKIKNNTHNIEEHNRETDAAKIKVALLNESDSDKSEKEGAKDLCGQNKKTLQETTKALDPEKIKDALLKDSDSDKNDDEHSKNSNLESSPHNIDMENLAKTVTDIIKRNLLYDSDSDQNDCNSHRTAENKCDTEKDNSNKKSRNIEEIDPGGGDTCQTESQRESSEKETTPIKVQRIKSSLLNESSDNSSKSDGKKTLQSKGKSVKKKLRRLSNSDAEKDHSRRSHHDDVRLKRKHSKKKSRYTRSSSSSSDDLPINPRKKSKFTSSLSRKNVLADSADEKGSDEDIRSLDNDKLSNASSRKMVRSKAKPSGSSGQSSDNQETSDKDIDRLTDLNKLSKSRRRDSTSTTATDNTQSTMATRRSSRPKAKSTIGEDFLQAESSSESSEEAANDDQDIEDLPPVPLSGLNGGGIEHLAKDDLLEDTDSSVSNKDKAEKADSEAENKVKLKRRKAHAISSDSEGGTSNKKDKEFKMSDFEDSGEESSETGTRSKRKKKSAVDSDSSMGSTEEGKKKRRRIKVINDSDASGSDTENEGRNKHGRKNIRKVMGKNQLEEATKKAAREEKERIARIAERQKLYNNLEFDESGKPDEVVLEKVVLDFDPDTKEPLIEVDRGLVKKLKPHQANGIKFMWDACFESVKRIKKDRGSGCILAHCMGLGKTLQVVSLTHTLLIHGDLTGVNRVLVVCPLSTVLNWVNEFRMWLKHADSEYDVDVYELSRFKQNSERAFQLQQWIDNGGVCVLGYEMFRNLSADNNKKFKKKMLKSFQESLVDPGPDLVVCDEGHLLKNEKTSLSQSMNKVRTRRRIVLTGTPLQNNLKEYYCMVQFVKPNLLGKYNEYLNRFVNPITNGQYTDSTEHDIKIMKRRSHVLHKMLDGAVQRRDYGVLAPFLPPKHEFVLFITLTELQIKLYQFYLDNYSRRPLPGKSSGFLFPDFQSLQRIWTHPLVLKYNSERYEIMQQKKREREEEDSEGSLVDFIDDDSTPDESSTAESSDDLSDMSDDSRKKSKKKKNPKKGKSKDSKANTRRATRANPVELEEDDQNDDIIEVKNENPTEWWIPLVEEEELEDMRKSNKLVLLFDILRQCEAIGDKLLVFSQSLYSLDLIEHFLGKVDEATQEGRIDEKLGGHVGSWSPGVDYFRLDGSTSCENRSIWCKNFNREDNPRARLFLISTRAGGLGINLVAANRVVIFDVSWNPSHDVQSIFRVYRFGQKKPCYIYRFLAMGTMEEKIYERQVTKQAISKRVIDEQQIDRHYAENDLAELYKFEPHPPSPRPVPSLPKDRFFAEMLKEHEEQIYKFHEHDSLLENKEEETLSEEERKAAWEDFENEKNRPPPAPFVAPWPMHNGMMPGLLAQQQQLAYAALAAMLRKDLPNINDNQIRDMLPLIYSSNPAMFGGYDYGLMQKMSEIYKYAQPGMMNPSMMNPAMNAGGGGGGAGSGGTSGLQYSPPWQRQQQQQQQMRLQQIMQQQQNHMGAKLYAGGLGSRDPIAMALQQQRAREIMMGGGQGGGGGGGRPRGRPPLQPRAPPAAPPPAMPAAHDVVNLDSD